MAERLSIILGVAIALFAASLLSGSLIDPDPFFWWAFILYGAGSGLLIGALVRADYSLCSIVGSWSAFMFATVTFWKERELWFISLLFATFIITIIGFAKLQISKLKEQKIGL